MVIKEERFLQRNLSNYSVHKLLQTDYNKEVEIDPKFKQMFGKIMLRKRNRAHAQEMEYLWQLKNKYCVKPKNEPQFFLNLNWAL